MNILGAPGWLSWLSIHLLILAQVMISVCGIEPHMGLCAQNLLGIFSPSLSLPALPLLILSLPLCHSLKIKLKKKFKK